MLLARQDLPVKPAACEPMAGHCANTAHTECSNQCLAPIPLGGSIAILTNPDQHRQTLCALLEEVPDEVKTIKFSIQLRTTPGQLTESA